MLALTGSGAYYYTAHGIKLPSFLQSKKPAASADLDAVASAWGKPSSAHIVDPALSSPIARSAKSESNVTEAKSEVAKDDRYAASATEDKADSPISDKQDTDTPTVAKVEPTAIAKKTSEELTEPTPASDEPLAKVTPQEAANKSNHSTDNSETAAVVLPTENAIARGQEPKDETANKLRDVPTDLSSTFDATASDNKGLTEPKPLVQSSQPGKTGTVSNRARQAFINTSPAAPSDRYGDSLSAGRDSQVPSSNGAVTSPFGAPPASSVSANARPGMIEPLPSSPDDSAGRINSFSQNNNGGLHPLEETGTASSLNRDLPSRAPMGQSPPRQASQSPYNRSLPPSNGLGHNNDNITPIPTGDGTGKPGEKALEGPQQPTLVIQKFAPGEIQVGKTAKFVVQIRNAGGQSADGVTIRDEIPQGTKLISTSPSAMTEGSHITWQIGKLSPGEDRTVEMQLMPTTEGDIGSVATVSYTAQASVKTRCTMPQLAIRMTAANEVMVGNQQHVKIEIRNPGSGDATGVMLFENVPPNVKHVAGPALEFELGTLHPNETRELDLVLTAEKAGKVVNTLTAKADGNLQVQQQVEFEVIAPGLTVALDGPERRYLERPATYEVSVVNPGTAPAHDVQIVTKLPKGMRFVRANNMGEYDAATHAVYWSLAELPKGEKGTVELVAMPTEAGPQTLQVDGHAQQGLADHKQRDIMVEGLAAIMFEVKDTEDPIEVNGETG
ncbi:MAG TPA: hypothetical protein VHU84_02360, partial [Lacipirellulaceae bacterium]|nr:hypothetical protein [Lacipirellulaceae bacterium]